MGPKAIGYWKRRGWKDLIFLLVCAVLVLAVHRYFFPPPLTNYQKWQKRPALAHSANLVSGRIGENGLPPCLFLVPPGGVAPGIVSGSVGDCLLLIPDGRILNLFEVNLRTGDFIPVKTDVHTDDTIPLAFTRVYRPIDEWSNRMQIYLMDVYDPSLTGSHFPYTFADWNLPDSQVIHYDRVSNGTGYADAVFEHSANTPVFAWSRVAWNSFGWDLNRQDGVVYMTPDAYYSTRPVQSSLVAIFDPSGHETHIIREANGNLTEIKSPNGSSIRLTYVDGRVSRVESNTGEWTQYEYDTYNRLRRASNSHGYEDYTFDTSNRVQTVTGSNSGPILQNSYDSLGRVVDQILNGNSRYQIHYLTDTSGNIAGAEILLPQSQTIRVTFHDQNYSVEQGSASPPGRTPR